MARTSCHQNAPLHSLALSLNASSLHLSPSQPLYIRQTSFLSSSRLNASSAVPSSPTNTAEVDTSSPIVKAQTIDAGTQYALPCYPLTTRFKTTPVSLSHVLQLTSLDSKRRDASWRREKKCLEPDLPTSLGLKDESAQERGKALPSPSKRARLNGSVKKIIPPKNFRDATLRTSALWYQTCF